MTCDRVDARAYERGSERVFVRARKCMNEGMKEERKERAGRMNGGTLID